MPLQLAASFAWPGQSTLECATGIDNRHGQGDVEDRVLDLRPWTSQMSLLWCTVPCMQKIWFSVIPLRDHHARWILPPMAGLTFFKGFHALSSWPFVYSFAVQTAL